MNSPNQFHPTLEELLNEAKVSPVIKLSVSETASIKQHNVYTIFGVGKQYFNAGMYGKAAEWYRKAADYDFPPAQLELGQMYFHGHGLPVDFIEAHRLYVKQSGDPTAQYLLGILYSQSNEPQYMDKAKAWFQCSAEGGHVEAQYRAALDAQLSKNLINGKHIALRYLTMAANRGHEQAEKDINKLRAEFGEEEALQIRPDIKIPTTMVGPAYLLGLQNRAVKTRLKKAGLGNRYWRNQRKRQAQKEQQQQSNTIELRMDDSNNSTHDDDEYSKLVNEKVELEKTIKGLETCLEDFDHASNNLLEIEMENKRLKETIRKMEGLFYEIAASSNRKRVLGDDGDDELAPSRKRALYK